MRPQILIGLYKEGGTDARFLESIIKRTFEDVSFECCKEMEISNIYHIAVKKDNFVDDVLEAAKVGVVKYGIMVLCVHTDADKPTDDQVIKHKIEPLLEKIQSHNNNVCKLIVPVIPIRMSEAWMLADKNLLKQEIYTKKGDQELGINNHPESFANPKQIIENAIRIAQQDKPRRQRHNVRIGELYQPLGESISLESLRQLPSFRKFENNVRNAFRELKYLN